MFEYAMIQLRIIDRSQKNTWFQYWFQIKNKVAVKLGRNINPTIKNTSQLMQKKNINKYTVSFAAMLSVALTGCGGGSSSGGSNGNGSIDSAPFAKLPALKSLSIPQTNFQTIKSSNFDIEPASNTPLNRMAYNSLQGDKRIFEVAFQPRVRSWTFFNQSYDRFDDHI